jgi:hypothetical protein
MRFFRKIQHILTIGIIFSALFSACAPATPGNLTPTPNLALTEAFRSALETATHSVPTYTATPSPTLTPTLTATPLRTPPALPSAYQTNILNPKDAPHSYVQGTCEYLKQKWDPNNAAPGTVVMPIMFHSITDGEINHEFQITAEAATHLLRNLKSQGFETITMQQLADFLQRNAKIPPRSVLLIVDDLHTESYYRDHFVPIFKEYGWSMVNAWISQPEDAKRVAEGNIKLQQEGWVDHQAHGVIHNINIIEFAANTYIQTELYGTVTADQFIQKELQGSMDAITATFGKAPIAYIWPGGNFSQKGVEVARQVGFKLGFTVNPRGPLMYNWIPQADSADPNRPSYNAEGYIKDPLMLLPRYWDIDASSHLDEVRQIGKAAAEYAAQNKATELEYYDILCQPQLGPIPTAAP